MACPRCQSPMKLNGDVMTCTCCPYQYKVAKRVPTIAELLEENEQLKKRIKELESL